MNSLKAGTIVRCIKALALLLFLWSWVAVAHDSDSWVRIDRPDADLRASLPPEAMDYGSFVWMPVSLAPRSLEPGQFQLVDRPFHLRVNGQSIDPLNGLPGADRPGRAALTGEADFHLVQFRGPIRREWLLDLEQRGLQPVQYMAPFMYIVWGRADQLPTRSIRANDPVRFAGLLPPAMRFSADELDARAGPGASLAMIYRPEEDRILAAIAAAGIEILGVSGMERDFRIVAMNAGAGRQADLAEIPGVLTVLSADFEPHSRGELSAQSVVGAIDNDGLVFPGYLDWLNEAELSGEGVVVSVVDEGIRQSHLDLEDRFVDCVPLNENDPDSSCNSNQQISARGTHVAGSIAGTGASERRDANGFLRGLGIAPGALLVDQLRPPLNPNTTAPELIEEALNLVFQESALSGAVIANFSWGLRTRPQGYDIPTRAIDLLIRDSLPESEEAQPINAIWAIYNGGGDRDQAGAQCNPSSLGTPEEAKNLLAVGATNLQTSAGAQLANIFDLYEDAAHGPACDGRLVPQIVAPGCHTENAASSGDQNHGRRCGTSYAAPLVSGAAALFVEQYRRDHGQDPSPALIRAMLTISAQDLAGNRDADQEILDHRPDRKQGWGRLDLDAVINRPRSVTVNQDKVLENSGESWQLRIAPEDPALPVRVMLAWTDAPGSPVSGIRTNPALVNDLDLLVSVGENEYRGNLFGMDGFSIPGEDSDRLNNLEAVILSPEQHGWQEIEIEVIAVNLAADALNPWNPDHGQPRQDFALVCYNCRTEPDFSLTVDPSPVIICLDGDGVGQTSAALQAEALLDFFGDIDLGDIEIVPADSDVSASASPTELRPGDSANLTVTANAASDRDDVRVLVQAAPTANPDATRQIAVPVTLLSEIQSAAVLLDPADDSTGLNLLPAFDWEGVERAQLYRFELATSTDFADSAIIADNVVNETQFQLLGRLDGNTEYFWRVTAKNECGSGIASSTGRFITGSNTPASMNLSFDAPPGILPSASPLPALTVNQVLDVEDAPANGVLVRLELRALSGSGWLEGELIRATVDGEVTFDDLVVRSDFGGELQIVATIIRDEVLPVPSQFQLSGGQSLSVTVPGGISRGGGFEGLRFQGVKTSIPEGNLSEPFAADLRMDMSSPNEQTFSVGGFDEKITAADWEFQDEPSVTDGPFSSQHPEAFPPGTDIVGLWTVRFTHDRRARSPMRWDEVELILLKDSLEQISDSFTVEGQLIFQDRFEEDTP